MYKNEVNNGPTMVTSTHPSLKNLVFTYGTLKRKEPNSGVLKPNQHLFVGTGLTKQTYPLVVATRHNIPCMLDLEGTGYNVSGEVFAVDDEMLKELDDFEEAPDVYQRMKADICMTDIVEPSFKSLAENAIFKCWVYRIKNFRHGLLKKPLLRSYLSAEQRAYTELDDKFDYSNWNDENAYWSEVLEPKAD